MIFFLFLPPLLFEAAWSVSFKEMKKWYRMILSFAFLVVFFTALSVALVANYMIPGFTIALGFLLGGIVSPPDAVSTGAITKFVKIPKTTSSILEGESLMNDASSLIIFRFALIAVGTGQFIWQEATTTFFWMVLVGFGIGLTIAWVFVQLHKRLPTKAASDVALTLVVPYFMYWAAEQIHCSGVLAVVSGGLYMSVHRLKYLSSASRIMNANVWESFSFILNGIVFLLIGLDLPEITAGLRANGTPLSTAVGYGVLVTAVLILARIISAFAAVIATRIFRPGIAPRIFNRKRFYLLPLLMGWTGMRGVVSLAAALSIPLTMTDGTAFPQRDLILFITFVTILLTLVVQGLTLPYFITRTKAFDTFLEEEQESETRKTIKKGLKQHVYQFVKEKYSTQLEENESMRLFMKHWDERAKASDESWMNEKSKVIFLEILEVQRAYLSTLNKDPKIDEDIIRQQLYQIDLEEERLRVV